jgi:hypothetical protein
MTASHFVALSLFAVCLACGPTPEEHDDSTPEEPNAAASQLFDGTTLAGWEGEAGYWSVEDGAITGETTAETMGDGPTYLIWRGGEVDDFVLTFEYRIFGDGNSGVQYRSAESDDFLVNGYQADFEGGDQWSGVLVEMGDRLHLALRGQKVRVAEDGKIEVVENFGSPEDLQALVHKEDWNQLEVAAQGNHLVHKINGQTMIDALDEQTGRADDSGIIAFQLNRSRPMKVQIRNIELQRGGAM